MRLLAIVCSVVVACTLAVVQFASSVALRDRAQAPAWVRVLPAGWGASVDRLDPSLPLPEALRLVLARHALARGDLTYARSAVALLHASRDRLALEGEISERTGNPRAAVDAYLAAGDLTGVEAAVAHLTATGRTNDALALQRAVVARLQNDPTQRDALAQAFYGLGGTYETRAYTFAVGTSERRTAERQALEAYERAARLAPLSLRYLIAVGNQRINIGDLLAARSAFERAHEVDPTSAEPWTGLGDVALRSGARGEAAAFLSRAQALDPHAAAVERLAAELGR